MNDNRHIRAALEQIAKQEIPDDMNLWENLKQDIPRSTVKATRSISLIVVLLMMLIAAVSVYAFVRVQTTDPGITGAMEANLVTELGISQTVNDVTLTLDWAYADATRIVIGYSAALPPEYQNSILQTGYKLTDADNSFYSQGGGGGGGLNTPEGTEYTSTFGAAFVENTPDTLHMRLEISLAALPNEQPSGEGSGAGGSGGGFGYGGGDSEATPEPGIEVNFGMNPVYSVGVFSFDFDLPFIPAIEIPVDQTVDVNGVSITLDRLTVTPSATKAELCFDLPTPEDWIPWATLMAGDVNTNQNGWELHDPFSPLGAVRCGTLTFYAPYQLEPVTFTLTVSELLTSYVYSPETAEEFRQTLADQGIEVEILLANGEGFEYNLVNQPDGVDVGAALNEAYRVFAQHTAGPWTFSVDIP